MGKNTWKLAKIELNRSKASLVALRDRKLVVDAELLEAYLEAVDPHWQAKIAQEIGTGDDNSEKNNPWRVLGLTPGASLEEVKLAYRKIGVDIAKTLMVNCTRAGEHQSHIEKNLKF